MTRQRPRPEPNRLVAVAELLHRLLNDPPPDPHAAHQTPVAMDFPILLASRVAQVHAPSEPTAAQKKMPKVGTTRPNRPPAPPNYLIRLTRSDQRSRKATPNCASWARVLPQVLSVRHPRGLVAHA